MDLHRLIKMANQISDFFAAYPDPEEAARQTADHLKSFWDPRMRREIGAYVRETGGPELKEIARRAVKLLPEATERRAST